MLKGKGYGYRWAS